jgi:hypothetical protein
VAQLLQRDPSKRLGMVRCQPSCMVLHVGV